jgi:hypothetical protein
MMMSLSFAPLIGWPFFIALVGLSLAVLIWDSVKRGAKVVWRALVALFLMLALLNPSFIREEREAIKDIALVVMDNSLSQKLDQREAATLQMRAALERSLAAFPDIEPRFIEADGSHEDGTQLFKAVTQAMKDVPASRLAGIIMITDGVVQDVPASLAQWGLNAPLHALITGHKQEQDRQITLMEAPRFGLIGKDVTVVAKINERGADAATGRAAITVTYDGKALLQQNVPTNQPFSLPITVAHGGANVIEIAVEPLSSELTLVNNRTVFTLEGIREKLRVLLVSGEPHAGERTWRNLLKSDANVDLVHFTILRPPEKQDNTPIDELSLIAFPTRELFQDKIKEFDLIIFDRYTHQSILPISYFDNINRYVREGGALLIAAGPEFVSPTSLARTRLSTILPALPDGRVIEEAFQPRLTSSGQRHPVTRDIEGALQDPPPWGEWLRVMGSQITGSQITGSQIHQSSALMSGAQNMPLFLLARQDKGRVALLLSDHIWLWARGFRGGGPHVDLLRRLSHWLMREPNLEEEALRFVATRSELKITRQTMQDQAPPVMLTYPSGTTSTIALTPEKPGLFSAYLTSQEQGLYSVTSGDLTAFASIGFTNSREMSDVLSDMERLRPLTETSGGSVRRLALNANEPLLVPRLQMIKADAARFAGGDWIGLRSNQSYHVRGLTIWPLGIGFGALLIGLGLLLTMWLREAR